LYEETTTASQKVSYSSQGMQ